MSQNLLASVNVLQILKLLHHPASLQNLRRRIRNRRKNTVLTGRAAVPQRRPLIATAAAKLQLLKRKKYVHESTKVIVAIILSLRFN